MVWADPQVRRPNRLVRPIAMDKAVRPALQASDALVALDAGRPDVDLPDPCSEVVRDFLPWASVDAPELKAALLPQKRPKPQLAAPRTVAYAFLAQFPVPHLEILILEPVVAPELRMVVVEHPMVAGKELP